MIVNKSFYPVPSSFSSVTRMQQQMESLQTQLSSGKRYNTLAEFGQDRMQDINLRARLGRIEGYMSNITTMENRLSFTNNAIERLDVLEADARALAVPGAYGSDGQNMANATKQAEDMLKEVIDLLNTDIAGKFVFGGNASDKRPVSAYDTIMNGAVGKAGFRQVALERQQADAGADGLGRLVLDGAGTDTVTLSEDASHPFGFKLANVSGGGTYASLGAPDGTAPQNLTVTFSAAETPNPGDTITIGLTLPDDRERIEYVTLTATDEDPPGPGKYLIGATETERADNFAAALGASLTTLGEGRLASASTIAAADDFFRTDGTPPQRVDGDPATATGLVDGSATTVEWYTGQVADAGGPRATVSAQIDETTKVRVGVTANESGFAELIKSLAGFATTNFTSTETDPDARVADEKNKRAQFDTLSDIARVRLSEDRNTTQGAIENIALELGLSANTLNSVKTRHASYSATLKTMLADIETAPIEEVAMQMLTLQTRLQASFQATTMVNELTLVNYLR